MSSEKSVTFLVSDIALERAINIQSLHDSVDSLQPIVNTSLQSNRARARSAAELGTYANLSTRDYVLLARDDFHAEE